MRPISEGKSTREPQCKPQIPEKLRKLQRMLTLNHRTQDRLRKIRDSISLRIYDLSDFISTYRLKIEYPPATGIISYIKFQRSTPNSLRQQSKVIDQQEAIKNTSEKDGQFINKLDKNKRKSLKKKEIDINQLPSDPKLINFQEVAYFQGIKTGLEMYRSWLEEVRGKQVKRPFDIKEESTIVEKQKRYGDNWQKICQFIDSRTFQEIYYQFHNRINPHLHGGRWTNRQSLMLIVLCEHFGTKRWAYISQKIVVKSQLQVRQRYCNIIDPTIGKNNWTSELQERLIEEAPNLKYSWKDIAKMEIFKDKTDNCIWRKYRNLMITKSLQEIYKLMPGGEKKGLIQKILTVKKKLQQKKQKSKGSLSPERYEEEDREEQPIMKMKAEEMPHPKVEPSQKHENIVELPQPNIDDSLEYIIYNQ